MAESDEPASPVRALRDTFGDPKPPNISRKITACVACRKLKIKCNMSDSQPPCIRCKKRGLSCTVNRSLQMLLESDVSWKHSMEIRMQKLEALVNGTIDIDSGGQGQESSLSVSVSEQRNTLRDGHEEFGTHGDQERQLEPHRELVMDLDSGPGEIPGFYVAQAPPKQPSAKTDIIDRGIITLEQARIYFDTYRNRLDHFPYRILGEHSTATLERIRQTSPLLTAATITIGALHLSSEDFDKCHNEFVSLSAVLSFSKHATIEDVRALCIGAFWLSDLSWSLVSAAVRIATELQLHRSFSKALQGDRKHYLRTRLYYLVYACDHQWSVAYGRPPMTRESEAIRNSRQFLGCEHATEDDNRLVSHILRWSICSNIFDTFGPDVDRPLSTSERLHLRRFRIELTNLLEEWADRHNPSAHVGNYPNKGTRLQYHFANLYLCSHAFRGLALWQSQNRSNEHVMELDEAVNSSVLSALWILRSVESDAEIQSFLNGLPVWFDTMIAFAAVFLLKVSTRFSSSTHIDVAEVKRLMNTLINILKRVIKTMHPRHLLASIAKGIENLVHRCGLLEEQPVDTHIMVPQSPIEQPLLNPGIASLSSHWTMEQTIDPNFMSEFDFLFNQDTDFAQNFTFDNLPSPT